MYGSKRRWGRNVPFRLRKRAGTSKNFYYENPYDVTGIMDANVSDGVLKKYGEERTMYVIANTIQLLQGDGRISQQNAHWAKREPIPNESAQDQSLRRDFLVRSHPGLFNLFANITRNTVIQAQLARREQKASEQDPPSILAQLEKPLPKPVTEKHTTKKKEQER